jgi:hypothetical protein
MRGRIIIFTIAATLSSIAASDHAEGQTLDKAIASECERVVRTFVELDGEGAQLTTAGQEKLANLFTQRGVPSTGKVSVVRDDVVVGSVDAASNSRMRVGVEYIYLGALTLADASYDNKPGGIKTRESFVLSVLKGAGASPVCKIEGVAPPPQLRLSAAIRRVTAQLDRARDAERRRLRRVLTGLKREQH